MNLPTGPLHVTVAAVALAVALGGAVSAQSYAAEPIGIDLSADDTVGAEPLLIAAYQPPAGALPQFAARESGRGAVVTLAGLPTPSIILGRVEPGQEAAFGITTLLPDTVAEWSFGWNDLDARNRLRNENPEIFRQLIEQGHIDPPEAELKVALQTELQRMNCYRAGIDGAWGPGSRRSIGEYFDEREDNASWPDQEPSNGLFRTIILHPDVDCPTPQVAATSRSSPTTGTRSSAATTTRRAQQPARTVPRSQPKPPASSGGIKIGGGTGVFR